MNVDDTIPIPNIVGKVAFGGRGIGKVANNWMPNIEPIPDSNAVTSTVSVSPTLMSHETVPGICMQLLPGGGWGFCSIVGCASAPRGSSAARTSNPANSPSRRKYAPTSV